MDVLHNQADRMDDMTQAHCIVGRGLGLAPRSGFVEQGLSVAGGALYLCRLGLAADKRYSSGRRWTTAPCK